MRRTARTALAGLVALAAATGFAGCSSTGSPARSGTAASSTTSHADALGSGCGRAPDPGPTTSAPFGDVAQSVSVAGTPRTYRLAVPTTYRRDRPTPLILDFHGSGSNAVQQSAYSQLPAEGASAGYLVVTPDARDGNWDLAAPRTQTDDQRLVAALESDLGARYCVARSRIYAAGISLGSEFATIAACDPANHIAAVGLVAAEYLLRPCR
ncbi:MAG TPA: PHB depolymerase family esterase, partial [Acidimicrobiales bacterium]